MLYVLVKYSYCGVTSGSRYLLAWCTCTSLYERRTSVLIVRHESNAYNLDVLCSYTGIP